MARKKGFYFNVACHYKNGVQQDKLISAISIKFNTLTVLYMFAIKKN